MDNQVISLSYPEPHIGIVSMHDTEGKNTFTPTFINNLIQTFETINHNNELKVVVIHGYESYFCCGGSKEELLALTEGIKTFADIGIYRILLDCKIPVISAMQGHAIGGGLALGCFADMLVMSNESFYTTNFMKYGFTPGFGSTYIIPKKFGHDLAATMLFGAQNYQGVELKEWGVTARFVKRNCVINTAIETAKMIAIAPREHLISLKEIVTKEDKELLPKYIEQELKMHQSTFILPEVKQNISELFGK